MITKEQLKAVYIDQGRTLIETAKILGCSQSHVNYLAKRYGLRKRKPYVSVTPERDEIKALYIDQMMTRREIAVHYGVSAACVDKWIAKFDLTAKALGLGEKKSQKSWTQGLSKESDERIARAAEKKSGRLNPMYGKRSWNSGATKETDERVAGISKSLAGKPKSPEHREKLAAAKRGKFGPASNRWKGGEFTPYPTVSTKDGKKYAHRALAEKLLRRPLATEEHVHHADRDKFNCSPENLIVINTSVHTALHSKCKSRDVNEQIAWLKSNGFEFIWLKNFEETA